MESKESWTHQNNSHILMLNTYTCHCQSLRVFLTPIRCCFSARTATASVILFSVFSVIVFKMLRWGVVEEETQA